MGHPHKRDTQGGRARLLAGSSAFLYLLKPGVGQSQGNCGWMGKGPTVQRGPSSSCHDAPRASLRCRVRATDQGIKCLKEIEADGPAVSRKSAGCPQGSASSEITRYTVQDGLEATEVLLLAQREAGARGLKSFGRWDDSYSSEGLGLFWPKPSGRSSSRRAERGHCRSSANQWAQGLAAPQDTS